MTTIDGMPGAPAPEAHVGAQRLQLIPDTRPTLGDAVREFFGIKQD
jgi:hypothetical protein